MMPLMRAVVLLLCLLCLAACAGTGETAGSLESTDAFVHKQLDPRGL